MRRVDVNVLFEGTTSNKCAFRSVNLKRVVRRNAMAEVGRKSWNRGCIPIVVFGRDKARISISHSPRSSLIPRILTAADLPPSPRRQLLFHSNRSRPSPYLSRNRSNDIRQIRLEIKRLRTSSFLYRLASVVESDRSFLLKKKKERKEGNVKRRRVNYVSRFPRNK